MTVLFLLLMFGAFLALGCCSGIDPVREKTDATENAKCRKVKDGEPFELNGRIVDFKKEAPDKKDLGSRWGFRAACGEKTEYILKKYPSEFDEGINPGFMHKRRAKLKLKLVEKREDGLKVIELLEVLDISKTLDGN